MRRTRRDQRRFQDRRAAGALLGELVSARLVATSDPVVVVGLARGGVVVAAEVARSLGAPLDALAVRKVGHPGNPEYALGAVAPDGTTYLRPGTLPDAVAHVVDQAVAAARALDIELHEGLSRATAEGATVVLVDDGLATGATMVAACRWARAQGATRVIAAAPVAASQSAEGLAQECDDMVAVLLPSDLRAVALYYEHFDQVASSQVREVLAAAGAG